MNIEKLRISLYTHRQTNNTSQNNFSKRCGLSPRKFRSLTSPNEEKREKVTVLQENSILYILYLIENKDIDCKDLSTANSINVDEIRNDLLKLKISQNSFAKLAGMTSRRIRALLSPTITKRSLPRILEANSMLYTLMQIKNGSMEYKVSERPRTI